MDGVAIERRLREFFKARAASEGIAAAWLFGPSARALSKSGADEEVGILFEEEPSSASVGSGSADRVSLAMLFPPIRGRDWAGTTRAREFGNVRLLQGSLKEVLGLSVQTTVLNDCEWLALMVEMLRDDRLLVERNRSQRVEFEVRTRNEFWDFEQCLRPHRSNFLT